MKQKSLSSFQIILIIILLCALVFQGIPCSRRPRRHGPHSKYECVLGESHLWNTFRRLHLGFTVELADASQWAAKSQSDFATYRALILGDATVFCIGLHPGCDRQPHHLEPCNKWKYYVDRGRS